jgi:Domain of unknown function (DUF4157)
MEARFGHDFSKVRIHSGPGAAAASRAIGAQAYTVGSDIVFGAARYEPDIPRGRHLLAHELTHVVQQRGGVHLQNGISRPDDVYERQADQVSNLIAHGHSVQSVVKHAPCSPCGPLSGPVTAPVQMKGEGTPLSAAPTAGVTATPGAGAAATPAKLHLFVDIDVKELGFSDLTAGDVGHTWISLEYRDPLAVPATVDAAHKPLLEKKGKYADPMGFWPAVNEGVGFSVNPLFPWVKGWMRHPDRAHEGAEMATQTWDIGHDAVNNVIKYAESKRTALYSVYDYNCTTFAKEAVEAAGKSPPGMTSMGFAMPNAAYDGIKERQKAGIGQTSVTDFDTKAVTVVNASDDKPKKR